VLQEADFIAFLNDPENPPVLPPAAPPKSPAEEWASLEGSDALLHLSAHDFLAKLEGRRALVMFYAPCEICDVIMRYHAACDAVMHHVHEEFEIFL
jgi:hypothetical protein